MSKKTTNYMHIASMACVVHCILTPFLIVFAPFIGHYFENLFLEISLLTFSILCGVFIVYKGYRNHKKQHCMILFSLGAALWIVHTVFELKDIFGAKLYFLLGTILVIMSYFLNHQLIKCLPNKS